MDCHGLQATCYIVSQSHLLFHFVCTSWEIRLSPLSQTSDFHLVQMSPMEQKRWTQLSVQRSKGRGTAVFSPAEPFYTINRRKNMGGKTLVLQYICIRQLCLLPPNLQTAIKIISHQQEKQPDVYVLLQLHSTHTEFQLWRLQFRFGTSYCLKEFDTVSLISKACLFHMLKASNSLPQLATVAKKRGQSITL